MALRLTADTPLRLIEGGRSWVDDERDMEIQALRTEALHITTGLLPDLNRLHLIATFHGDAISEQLIARRISRTTRYRRRNADDGPRAA